MKSVPYEQYGWLCPDCKEYVGFHEIHEQVSPPIRKGKKVVKKAEYVKLDKCKKCKMGDLRSRRGRPQEVV